MAAGTIFCAYSFILERAFKPMAHSESCQTSETEHFAKRLQG